MGCTDSKACTKCRRELPLSDFHRDPSKRDGRVAHCRDCKRGMAPTEGLPDMQPEAIAAFNQWRAAEPGQLQWRPW